MTTAMQNSLWQPFIRMSVLQVSKFETFGALSVMILVRFQPISVTRLWSHYEIKRAERSLALLIGSTVNGHNVLMVADQTVHKIAQLVGCISMNRQEICALRLYS